MNVRPNSRLFPPHRSRWCVTEYPSQLGFAVHRNSLAARCILIAGDGAIQRVLSRVHLDDAAGRGFRTYSLGMKQRLGIAAATPTDLI